MREHLYQGKRIDNGEWVEGSYVRAHKWFGDGKAGHFIYDIYGENRVLVDPETVREFTGRRDKNGKRIFEGDILQDDNRKILICFHEGNFCYIDLEDDVQQPMSISDCDFGLCVECDIIIGNKWDNPELLESNV